MGVIIADEDFIDPTQYIVDEIEVFGIRETGHVRMKKLLSAEESMIKDNVEKKLRFFVFENEEPFIIERGPYEIDNSKTAFILDLPFFE
mgnify:CR=1 FL=1